MSRADDRIPVPTNGHRPPLEEAAGAGALATPQVGGGAPPDDSAARPDLRIAVTPAQAAVGFGVIASLILLLVGARRRRR
jgi:hypothetical protein